MGPPRAQDRGNKSNFEELDVAVDELAGMWVVRATDPISTNPFHRPLLSADNTLLTLLLTLFIEETH